MKIALTGHREERLPNVDNQDEIIKWIRMKLIENHCTDAYCGMATGADIIYGKIVIMLKKEGYPIKLHCILPCKDYNITHPDYLYLKENSDSFEYLSEEFYRGCDSERDKKMINECEILLAVWDGIKSGGVWSTIRKAEKEHKVVINYPE